MSIESLSDFYLVGGTNLALRYGHRVSVDLDLFCISEFENETVFKILESNFKGFTFHNRTNPIGVFGFIDGIKVDFVRHHYFKLIDDTITDDGIRMFGAKDILAMKTSAILRRAQKKDFFDLAELLKHFTIQQIIEFHSQKYPSQQLLISIPYALTYFDEAEDSDDPVSLNGETWKSVKKKIRNAVSDYLK